MLELTKGLDIHIPIRLELAGVAVTGVVGGAGAGAMSLKLANKESLNWETETITTDYTLEELSEGDYTLTVKAGANDSDGFLRVKCFDSGASAFDPVQYVIKIREEKSFQYFDRVFVAESGGVHDLVFPTGTIGQPSDDMVFAGSIAIAKGVDVVDCIGLVSQGTPSLISNITYRGSRRLDETADAISLVSAQFTHCYFDRLSFKGAMSATSYENRFDNCSLRDFSIARDVTINRSYFNGTFTALGDNVEIVSSEFSDGAVLNLTSVGAGESLKLVNCSGNNLHIANVDNNQTVDVSGFKGSIIVDASCTTGGVLIDGVVNVTDSSAGATVTVDSSIGVASGLATEAKQDTILANVATVDAKVVVVDGKVVVVEGKVDAVQVTSDAIEADTSAIGSITTDTNTKVGVIDGKVDDVKTVVDTVEVKTSQLNFTGSEVNAISSGVPDVNIIKVNGITIESTGGYIEAKNEEGFKICSFNTVDLMLRKTEYLDFMTKDVTGRTPSGNPSQYKVGTASNQEIIDVTYNTVDSIEKVDTETVQ